ncbi:MAG: hypothetical protein AMXMBFR58_20810 [Phycisphaerae bacterium]
MVYWSLLALLLAATLGVGVSWVRQIGLARERTGLFESLSNIRNLREKTSMIYSRSVVTVLTTDDPPADLVAEVSAELDRLRSDARNDDQLAAPVADLERSLDRLNRTIRNHDAFESGNSPRSWATTTQDHFDHATGAIEEVRKVQLARFADVLKEAQEGAVVIQIAMLAVLVIAVAGLTTGGLLVRREIRRRDRLESLRRASERKLERAEEIAHIGYWLNDRSADTVSGSAEYFRIMGLPPSESVPVSTIFSRIHPADIGQITQLHQRLAEDPRDCSTEYRIRLDNGEVRHLVAHITTESDARGRLVRTFGTVQDITDRRNAEAQARAWRLRFETAVKAAGLMVYERDPATNAVRWEGAVFETLGVAPDALADLDAWKARILPEDLPGFEESLARHDAANGGTAEYRVRHADGRALHVMDRSVLSFSERGEPAVVGLILDMSDRKRLEEELLQAQKLESIGRLAGGVAHDLNNWLTAILGFAGLARIDHEVSHLLGYLDRIELAGNSAAKMTGQLLAYARRRVIEPRPCSLNDVVRDASSLLRPLLGEDIKVRIVPDPALWTVRVDPGQFEQVVVNLAVNARDAMPEGGVLTIETSNVELDDEYGRTHPEVTPGQHVLLAVSDTGTGIPPSQLTRIFDPFYTTKPRGAGTGLGLATVLGLVKQHHGHIWVYSEVGKGTTFKIYIPRDAASRDGSQTPPTTDAAPGSGTETVLVVEDESLVRELAVAALRHRGYTVLEAGTAEEAVDHIRSFPGEIHLLLTDVIMPNMSGKQIAERMAAVRPATRVLYTSGYTDNVVVHHGILDNGVQFLQKPYTPVVLASKVRAVLDGVAAPGT